MDERFKRHVEHLLNEAEIAGNVATSGLLDRTDCLELISRLANVTRRFLAMQEETASAVNPAQLPVRLYPYPHLIEGAHSHPGTRSTSKECDKVFS